MAVKYICDSCGKDCGLHGIWIMTQTLENPAFAKNKSSFLEIHPLGFTPQDGGKQFLLCSECYNKTNLPNEYSSKFKIDDNNAERVIYKSLKELVEKYGEDGYFYVNDEKIMAAQLLEELRQDTDIGHRFCIDLCSIIASYLMKFGKEDKKDVD